MPKNESTSPLQPGESETLLSTTGGAAEAAPLPTNAPPPRRSWIARLYESKRAPALRLLLYYFFLIALMTGLVWWVPLARGAFLAPSVLPALQDGAVGAGLTGIDDRRRYDTVSPAIYADPAGRPAAEHDCRRHRPLQAGQ